MDSLLEHSFRIARFMRRHRTRANLIKTLRASGYSVLGVGGYAVVVSLPEDNTRVLRVSTSRVDGGIYYHKWVYEKGNPKGAPKIERMYVLKDGRRFICCATVMPRYVRWGGGNFSRDVGGISMRGFHSCLKARLSGGRGVENLRCATEVDIYCQENAIQTLNTYANLLEACREELFPRQGYDLGGENIMLDGSTAIITDPFSGVLRKSVRGVWKEYPYLTKKLFGTKIKVICLTGV